MCRERLLERLREPAPSRIQLLTGPRQVGKTTLLLEIAKVFGDAAVYAAGATGRLRSKRADLIYKP
jgi:predicted AAA+ superfamily ATPase